MEDDKILTSKEVLKVMENVESLEGEEKLELLGILLEKLANGDVEVNGQSILPEEIGVDDCYFTCATIYEIISRI